MEKVIVLFEVTLKPGHAEHYLTAAAALKEELSQAEGFLGSERFASLADENKLLSRSEWRDEACVEKWRTTLAHRMAQTQGSLHHFADYRITVAAPLRSYTTTARDEAPADSNRYFHR